MRKEVIKHTTKIMAGILEIGIHYSLAHLWIWTIEDKIHK